MPNILIADSGSTKTDWRFIPSSNSNIIQFQTIGLNPFHHTVDSIQEVLEKEVLPKIDIPVEAVYFYGAGCSALIKQNEIKGILQNLLPQAKIEIGHDLLAAARATLGKTEGMIAILGTGSNAAYYNGEATKAVLPSLGFILGDEGSGVSIGKAVLKAFYYQKFSAELTEAFEKRYLPDLNEILDTIYKKPLANKYIAQFSQFAFHHRYKAEMSDLIIECFREFFNEVILKIANQKSFENFQLKLALVGSIAFYYADFIKSVADENSIEISVILEKPIAALSLYHSSLTD